MPQMSPLWWFPLFFFFSITLILFSLFNYFININQSNTEYTSPLIKPQFLNWQW
uniref:ATP synthase complex subunit 8 n=1 Tax=Ruidocollaris obscura TaxID=948400 RepID=A0A0N9LHC3_9ORTH|nr:ATP synthase F0 subunit 8 [Ruidocollaris obscura]ALG66393.1 ATP synthase F0 subunit 8 [Ruidocollaris obscura]